MQTQSDESLRDFWYVLISAFFNMAVGSWHTTREIFASFRRILKLVFEDELTGSSVSVYYPWTFRLPPLVLHVKDGKNFLRETDVCL